jgi:hypothetical protein
MTTGSGDGLEFFSASSLSAVRMAEDLTTEDVQHNECAGMDMPCVQRELLDIGNRRLNRIPAALWRWPTDYCG